MENPVWCLRLKGKSHGSHFSFEIVKCLQMLINVLSTMLLHLVQGKQTNQIQLSCMQWFSVAIHFTAMTS